jgi:hypothetical protein
MLIPSENEISRAGPLLASCRSESIHSGSPDNPQRNIQHEEEPLVAQYETQMIPKALLRKKLHEWSLLLRPIAQETGSLEKRRF